MFQSDPSQFCSSMFGLGKFDTTYFGLSQPDIDLLCLRQFLPKQFGSYRYGSAQVGLD